MLRKADRRALCGIALRLKTGRAYSMRVTLQDIYNSSFDRKTAEGKLKKLYFWLTHSGLEPMKKFAGTLKNHWEQILNYDDDISCLRRVTDGTNHGDYRNHMSCS